MEAATQTLSGGSFDIAFDDTATSLFGVPAIVGNSIVFSPPAFAANSTDGAGQVSVDRTINLQLMPHLGQAVQMIGLLEHGSYQLSGSQSDVYASGELRVSGLTNPAIQVSGSIIPNTLFGFTGSSVQSWQGTAAVTFDGSGIDQSAGINLRLQNLLEGKTLRTDSTPLRVAFVGLDTSGQSIALNVTMVPEPETWALLMTGLGVLGAAARRSNRKVARRSFAITAT